MKIVILVMMLFLPQTSTSVWDGVYAETQADRGKAVYVKDCGACHGDSLQGRGQAPPLAGTEFLGGWDGQPLGDLFEKIQQTMPADSPGRLSKEENADILAFLLLSNRFPAGAQELPGDPKLLNKIRIEAMPPKK